MFEKIKRIVIESKIQRERKKLREISHEFGDGNDAAPRGSQREMIAKQDEAATLQKIAALRNKLEELYNKK